MRRIAFLVLVCWTSACNVIPEPETDCFGVTDAPSADQVQDNLRSGGPFPPPGYEYDEHPQTEQEAEESTRGHLRARFAGSSREVMCLLDEVTVECEETRMSSQATGWKMVRAFACVWTHPDAGGVPEDGRTELFVADDVR